VTADLSMLESVPRLLFAVPLKALQGRRFQPTGFPNLGAAVFQAGRGTSLLVESAQSMANRLELTLWDDERQDVKEDLAGLSHVRVGRAGQFLTDSILEAHRLNSPYIEKSVPEDRKEPQIHSAIKAALLKESGAVIDRREVARTLLKYDIGCLLHGVFLESIDGRIRIARALSAFIEADEVQTVASGGVKNDHLNPAGVAKNGFGHVPFARDEFSADKITLYINLDLAQIRGYRLGPQVERLLVLLALYKVRSLLDGGLRLRTACELALRDESIVVTAPRQFTLPDLVSITESLISAIRSCASLMTASRVNYEAPLTKGKEQPSDEEVAAPG
jgi:CRISPR-associated protein Csb1